MRRHRSTCASSLFTSGGSHCSPPPTYAGSTSQQIAELFENRDKIFLDTFMRIVPFGDYYKKDKAAEIIRQKVIEAKTRRRCLRLLELIPEKKSLLLAQKALNCRGVDDVMDAFAYAEVSPVTISKRHDVKKLDNLYKFM